MKKTQKRPVTPISSCICLKSNKFIYRASLFAFGLGIFLLPKTAQMAAITPDKILELINQERAESGLNNLQTDSRLTSAAAEKVKAILESQTFDHTINGRKFSAWVKNSGYKYSIAGENLAIDFITGEGVVKAWMASENHRKNILDEEYSATGIAIIDGEFNGQKTIIVAQIFGAPLLPIPPIPDDIARRQEILRPREKNNIALQFKHLPLYYKLASLLHLEKYA
jgi:hypothetical protein